MFGAAGTFIKTSQYAQNQGKVCCTIGVHTIVTVVDGLLCAKPTRYHIDTWDEMMMERDKRLTGHKRGQKVCSWIDSYELCTTNYAMFFFFSQTQFRLKDSRLVASGLQSQHNNLFAHCFINLTVACFPPLLLLVICFHHLASLLNRRRRLSTIYCRSQPIPDISTMGSKNIFPNVHKPISLCLKSLSQTNEFPLYTRIVFTLMRDVA